MKGILKKVDLKKYTTKDGRNFNKFEFEVEVELPNGDVRTRKGSYSEDFAKKYFNFCKVKTKDLIGKEVGVTLAKRTYEANGEKRTYEYIKWLNILDKDGQPVFMPSENAQKIDF